MLWCVVQHLSKICYESIINFKLLALMVEQMWHVFEFLNYKKSGSAKVTFLDCFVTHAFR